MLQGCGVPIVEKMVTLLNFVGRDLREDHGVLINLQHNFLLDTIGTGMETIGKVGTIVALRDIGGRIIHNGRTNPHGVRGNKGVNGGSVTNAMDVVIVGVTIRRTNVVSQIR